MSVLRSVELRQGEDRSSPGSRGEKFLGSCGVASRNCLIHEGETDATQTPRSGPKGVLSGRRGVLLAELDGSLATTNFRELNFSTHSGE